MKTVKFGFKKSITLYDSIRQLPINRYTDFQKYALQASGIGSTMEDVDKHYKMLDFFLASGAIDEARRERQNLHMGLYLQLNQINIDHICFGHLLYSVNGKVLTDFSESNLIELCKRLGEMGLKQGDVADILSDVKKNLVQN